MADIEADDGAVLRLTNRNPSSASCCAVDSIDFHAGDARGDNHHPDPDRDHHPDHDTDSEGKRRGRGTAVLAGWEVVRACLVSILAIGLLSNICAHYLWHVTWHRSVLVLIT